MYYSPVRLPNKFGTDLHTLSTPPTFTLSQDQTLNKVLRSKLRSIYLPVATAINCNNNRINFEMNDVSI